tara:strand:- start:8711 stop:9268 length:558 start_codon:yes stop_codon:yes gene_type:complete
MKYFKYYNGFPGPTSLVYTGELIENKLTLTFNNRDWFNRELKGIGMLSNKEYLPNVLDVNVNALSITVEHGTNLNHALYENLKLPQNWKQQVLGVVKDLEQSSVYKLNLYPHTFMFVNNKVKLIDLYACAGAHEKIEYSTIESIVQPASEKRFKFIKDGYLEIDKIYQYTKDNNAGEWEGDMLNG